MTDSTTKKSKEDNLLKAVDAVIERWRMADSIEGVDNFRDELHEIIIADREKKKEEKGEDEQE